MELTRFFFLGSLVTCFDIYVGSQPTVVDSCHVAKYRLSVSGFHINIATLSDHEEGRTGGSKGTSHHRCKEQEDYFVLPTRSVDETPMNR